MASRTLNPITNQTPTEDSGDEPPTPLGSFSQPRRHPSATQTTPNNDNRPSQPSTLSPEAEIHPADRPAKRRRTVNDLPAHSVAASRDTDSPRAVPSDAPSPIQIDTSGPFPFANRGEIPTMH